MSGEQLEILALMSSGIEVQLTEPMNCFPSKITSRHWELFKLGYLTCKQDYEELPRNTYRFIFQISPKGRELLCRNSMKM